MSTTPYANSLFEQPWWLDIVAPGQWKEAVIKSEAGETIARMPYVMTGKRIHMPPLTQTLGIWMAPEIKKDYGKQKNVINELYAQLPSCRMFEQSLSPENGYVLPFHWLGCCMEPRFTYRLTDLKSCDKLYQCFSKTAKKNVRRAGNQLQIVTETHLDHLLQMMDRSFAAQGRKCPVSEKLVTDIVLACDASGNGRYIEARDLKGNVHACSYFVYDSRVCYDLLGGSDSQFRSSGAKSLVLWEGIQFAAANSAVFDFEGSMVEGIENFFRQFGGVCTPYYTISKRSFLREILQDAKPRVKRLIGYKM